MGNIWFLLVLVLLRWEYFDRNAEDLVNNDTTFREENGALGLDQLVWMQVSGIEGVVDGGKGGIRGGERRRRGPEKKREKSK